LFGICAWVLCCGLAFVPGSFQAFVRTGSQARWQTLPVPYRIHSGGVPSLGNGSEFIAIQKAFQNWENLSSCAIAFQYEGTTHTQNGGNDGVNVMSFQSNFSFGSATIAVTISTSSQGRLIDSDILFNPSNPNITFATDGRSDAFDIQAIATHEIGHFLGLDHTSIVSATMNPTGARGTVFPRALKSDDIIGASTIYPEAEFTNNTGGLRGRVTNSGTNVFGAHVVVLDGEGNAVVSTLTELDGSYQITGLPPRTYSLYAEPLDGPVTESSIGGHFDSRVNVNFTTTFFGNTLNPQQRQTFQISSGNTLQEINIAVFPSPASPLNLTSPSLGQRVPQGTTLAFTARGEGVVEGVSFLILGPSVGLANPVFTGGNSMRLTATIDANASIGLRTIFGQRSDATAALSGGLIITGQPPTLSSISPSGGGIAGGTQVTVIGENFRPGMEVSLGGAPLTHVSILDSTTLTGTTVVNKAGSLTLLAVNPDGTSASLPAAFNSQVPPQYVPYVVDTPRFRTNLGLTNLSASPAQATLTLYGANGDMIASRSVSVAAGGLTQLNNVISFIRGLSPLETNNLSGSVVIATDQPIVTYATQIDNTSNDPSLLIGKAAGGNQLLIPSTTSVNQFRSSLVVQNAGTAPAQVQLRLRDTEGVIRGELVVSIQPNGHFSSDDIHASLGVSGLFGPLEITSLDSVPLVTTSRVFSINSGTSGFFEGQQITAMSNSGIIPISQDSHAFRTNLGVNNLGNTSANVQVRLFSNAGSLLGTTTINVPPHGLVQLNSVNRTLTGASGVSNTSGYIRITSSQPVLGFASLINNSGDDPGLAVSWAAGASRLIIPSSTNVNQFRSTLTVINLSSDVAAPVRVVARDLDGNILAQSSNILIPPNAIYSEEDILSSLGLDSRYGPLEIQSLNGIPLSAVSRVYSIIDNTSGFFSAQPF